MKVEYGNVVKGKKFFKTTKQTSDLNYSIISLRLNEQEQEELKELMGIFNTKVQSQAIKKGLKVARNVLQGL